MADIQVITGCVLSGKTEALYGRIIRHHDCRNSIVVINWLDPSDESPSDGLSTNQCMSLRLPKDIPVESVPYLARAEKLPTFRDSRVIAVDEAHFFTDLVPTVALWRRNYPNKIIILAGVDNYVDNYNTIVPTRICALSAYACEYNKLRANCDDCLTKGKWRGADRNACYSYRITKGALEKRGNKGDFIALCPKHFHSRTSPDE